MDWIQWYFIIWYALVTGSRVHKTYTKPNEQYTDMTNAQYAAIWPIGFAAMLPFYGRIMGWW